MLGGGSAGFLAAITLKAKLPNLEIELLRSPKIGIIGVGEGTTAAVPKNLHGYLGIPIMDLYREAAPTWKLGIQFRWGSRPCFNYSFGRQLDAKWPELSRPNGFYCGDNFSDVDLPSSLMDAGKAFPIASDGLPFIANFSAYHFENEQFVGFLEKHAISLGVIVRDADVSDVKLNESGVEYLTIESGEHVTGDLFIDASGFQSVLLKQHLKEPYTDYRSALFCDRALVGGWEREDEPILPYTAADSMESGWSWQIEHESRINRGYVYSSSFISDDQAEAEFRQQNPKIESTRIVSFPSGRLKRFWVKNVVGVGNASAFVEPLEATSLAAICGEARFLAESLYDCQFRPNDSQRSTYNHAIGESWDEIRDFLAIHYKFNARLDTEFWKACRNDVDLGGATPVVEFYKQNGPTLFAKQMLIGPFNQFGLEGYYTLLFGLGVPFDAEYQPTADELNKFNKRCQHHKQIASKSMSIKGMLEKLRSPDWKPHIQSFDSAQSGIPVHAKPQ